MAIQFRFFEGQQIILLNKDFNAWPEIWHARPARQNPIEPLHQKGSFEAGRDGLEF
jgi:hypothetical protein